MSRIKYFIYERVKWSSWVHGKGSKAMGIINRRIFWLPDERNMKENYKMILGIPVLIVLVFYLCNFNFNKKFIKIKFIYLMAI